MALELARMYVKLLPDGTTCHEVAEAIAPVLKPWKLVRGRFNGFEHSWLELDDLILDLYPWASASGPLLIVKCLMWSNLYEASDSKS